MHVIFAFFILSGFISGFHQLATPPKGEVCFTAGLNNSIRIRSDLTPLSESTFDCIVKQNFDYSCGSAALGTVLNNYLGENFSEKQIIKGLMDYGDKEQIKKLRAFSLWDMQKFVEALGYKCGGYTADLDDLKNPELWPCMVMVELFSYRHFVILKGVYNGHVFVADPWRGNSSYTISQFTGMWHNNILFRVYPKYGKALSCLNLKEKDLRFIDKDMEKTLMFDVDKAFNLPKEFDAQFLIPKNPVDSDHPDSQSITRRYKH